MSTLEQLTNDRKKLILHRISRAVYEKLQREDVMALFAYSFTEAHVHVTHNMRLEPSVLKENYALNSQMLIELLKAIQRRCKFDWNKIIHDILREEGVDVPTGMDELLITLAFVRQVTLS